MRRRQLADLYPVMGLSDLVYARVPALHMQLDFRRCTAKQAGTRQHSRRVRSDTLQVPIVLIETVLSLSSHQLMRHQSPVSVQPD